MRLVLFLVVAAISVAAAQSPASQQQIWQMQESGTTAGLRGIDSVDATVAWASGTGGTVLKTADGGRHWQHCAIPDADIDGATLDFRGVQAWDAQTAIVMASGPGDKSRLYKTTDGCKSWKLLYTNPDKDGFWDAFTFWDRKNGLLLGDPTENKNPRGSIRAVDTGAGKQRLEKDDQPHLEFTVLFNEDEDAAWRRQMYSFTPAPTAVAHAGDSAAFAASNSALTVYGHTAWFGTGGKGGARVFVGDNCGPVPDGFCDCSPMPPSRIWFTHSVATPIAGGNDSSGIFSLNFRDPNHGIAAGGDYTKPSNSTGTAAWSADGGEHWTASTTPPHGYRSTVEYSESLKLWITAGTNGSDLSRDDGKTWQPLDNGNWNALSLPFIVGPKGRIARLNPAAIPKP